MHNLLLDENHFPSSSLIFLLDLLRIPHDYSLKSIVRITQQQWLQKLKERWRFESRDEHKLPYILPFLNKLGFTDSVWASHKEYDYAIVLGGFYTRMQERLNHLFREWEKGVRFREIVFLTAQRVLDSEKEAPLEPLRHSTETQLMLHLWHTAAAPPSLKNLPCTYIDVPRQKSSKSTSWRPRAQDALLQWLKLSPQAGKCLVISSQPFISYQHSVLSTYLPCSFTLETVGSSAQKDLPLSVYLDNLARLLYQEQVRRS